MLPVYLKTKVFILTVKLKHRLLNGPFLLKKGAIDLFFLEI